MKRPEHALRLFVFFAQSKASLFVPHGYYTLALTFFHENNHTKLTLFPGAQLTVYGLPEFVESLAKACKSPQSNFPTNTTDFADIPLLPCRLSALLCRRPATAIGKICSKTHQKFSKSCFEFQSSSFT